MAQEMLGQDPAVHSMRIAACTPPPATKTKDRIPTPGASRSPQHKPRPRCWRRS